MLLTSSTKAIPLQQGQLTSTKGQQQFLASGNCLPQCETNDSLKSNKEIMEAMSKLDAKLVAYLAGDDISTEAEQLTCEHMQKNSPLDHLISNVSKETFHRAIFPSQQQLLKHISGIKLQMEALTLQAEGTKRMELLQHDIRPICTVECQLSHDIVKGVPRYDMYHIMQFESEKFHSLTQCTRFGQEAQREVCYSVEKTKDGDYNFGQITFAVWWREPGTCMSEMLGIGVLELKELFYASLEKCKCITINRHGVHLASLYFKISLQLEKSVPYGCKALKANETVEFDSMNQFGNDNPNGHGNGDDNKVKSQNSNPQQQNKLQADSVKPAKSNSVGDSAVGKNNEDKLLELDSSEFTVETSKVRLLKGFLYASETRNLEILSNCDYILVCRRFWSEEAGATTADADKKFNYQEQFSVINDDKFLNCVNMRQLQLEIWRRHAVNMDSNGNADANRMEALGLLHLPLHQFFIAYRDAAITNHLWKAQMPVISIDAWVPITCRRTRRILGEIKCLLAIGSEEQIKNLKQSRSLEAVAVSVAQSTLCHDKPIDIVEQQKPEKSVAEVTNARERACPQLSRTADLFDMLQNTLNQPPEPEDPKGSHATVTDEVAIEQLENSLGLTHLNLGQAIKRKFVELEQISQRLRTRLSDVTDEQLGATFDMSLLDDWQPLDETNVFDAEMEEFEHDLNNEVASLSPPSQSISTSNNVDALRKKC